MKRLVAAALFASLACAAAAQPRPDLYNGHDYPWEAFLARFDDNAPVFLKGRIRKMEWSSPHAIITLEATHLGEHPTAKTRRVGAREPERVWRLFTASGIELKDKGIDPVALARGREVEVRGYRAKDRSCEGGCMAQARDITFAGGRKYLMSNLHAEPAEAAAARRYR